MKEKLLTLMGEIEDANRRQARLYEKLERSWGRYRAAGEYSSLVETAFYLNQLYSGYERVLEAVAEVFGNSVEGPGRHKSLLEKMRLHVKGLRPALVGDEAFWCLNELRAFRHFFRHAYDIDLEPGKVELVVTKALRLKELWAEDTRDFMHFLEEMARMADDGPDPG
ncbi:MAG: hypothetical protein H5U04_06755 [Firmicutes bacterium]|nr:hypothetical protein [Bacillota bacterium]